MNGANTQLALRHVELEHNQEQEHAQTLLHQTVVITVKDRRLKRPTAIQLIVLVPSSLYINQFMLLISENKRLLNPSQIYSQ